MPCRRSRGAPKCRPACLNSRGKALTTPRSHDRRTTDTGGAPLVTMQPCVRKYGTGHPAAASCTARCQINACAPHLWMVDHCRCREILGGFDLVGYATHRADRDDLNRILRLHRRDRVTSVDRAFERIGAVYCSDIADLRDIKRGRNTRRDVLAVGGRWRDDVRVVFRDIEHRAIDVLGQSLGKLRCIGQ